MEKVLTRTPISSLIVFLVFITVFNTLINNYTVTSFQIINVDVLQIDYNNNVVYLKSLSNRDIEINTEVQLVYSEQEQVLKGKVKCINNRVIEVQFEQLGKLDDVQIRKAEYKFGVGKVFVKEELELWK